VVQLPPEYHHGRPYPVLFLLHESGATCRSMVDRFNSIAARHGWILAAPEWEQGVAGDYNYTTEEHNTVLDTLKDLCCRIHVDTDRVCLFGLEKGANMAYDVGLSHPDLFAGVIPMGGQPRFFAFHYRDNGQYLPFYVVDGTHQFDLKEYNRPIMERWIPFNYPVIWVQYKGRGPEFFAGELPTIFDWMERKRRTMPLAQIGRDSNCDFQTMRHGDNRFYWVSTTGISDRCVNDIHPWDTKVQAAHIQASVRENNLIQLQTSGIKQATIWFGRNLIDLKKPVTVMVGSRSQVNQRVIKPSLGVMLEDYFSRRDKYRLYLAKLDMNL
jgi:hypothetical protein